MPAGQIVLCIEPGKPCRVMLRDKVFLRLVCALLKADTNDLLDFSVMNIDTGSEFHVTLLLFFSAAQTLTTQNNPDTAPVSVSTSILRYAGLDPVPGIMEIAPAIGHRNLAPPYSRISRIGRRQFFGTPFRFGS